MGGYRIKCFSSHATRLMDGYYGLIICELFLIPGFLEEASFFLGCREIFAFSKRIIFYLKEWNIAKDS